MNIPNVSNTIATCQDLVVGHLHQVSTAVAQTYNKVVYVAGSYFVKAMLISRMTLETTWAATKDFANHAADVTKTAASAFFDFAKIAGSKIVEISHKIGSIAHEFFAKICLYFSIACTQAKAGATEGFQVAKTLIATHQKEIAIFAACGLVIGLSAYYAISSVAAHYKKEQAV
jgi:hypothetical protein